MTDSPDSPDCKIQWFTLFHVHSDAKPLTLQSLLVNEVFLYKQYTFSIYTQGTFGKWRQKLLLVYNSCVHLLFRVCCMRYWMASGHSLLQKMTKEWVRTWIYFVFEEYCFWKSSPQTERNIDCIISSLLFSVRRYLLSLIQCLAQHRITSLELQKILQLFQYSHISRVSKLKRSTYTCSTSYHYTILTEVGE